MKHIEMTCLNHPNLRWFTKEIAVNKDGSYNGARNLHFKGRLEHGKYVIVQNDKPVQECTCSNDSYVIAK